MLNFKQFIIEMTSLYVGSAAFNDKQRSDRSRRYIMDLAAKEDDLGQKKSETATHHVFEKEYKNNSKSVYFVSKKTGKVDGHVAGWHDKTKRTMSTDSVTTRPESEMKAHQMYHHLLQHHNEIHSSTNQNVGSMKVWKKFSGMKGVKMSRSDNKKIHRLNWKKNYGKHHAKWNDPNDPNNDMHFIARKK